MATRINNVLWAWNRILVNQIFYLKTNEKMAIKHLFERDNAVLMSPRPSGAYGNDGITGASRDFDDLNDDADDADDDFLDEDDIDDELHDEDAGREFGDPDDDEFLEETDFDDAELDFEKDDDDEFRDDVDDDSSLY